MRKFRKYIYALGIALALSSCDNFEDMNVNPNAPVDVPSGNIFLSATYSSVARLHGASLNMTYAGLWVQHVSKIQYVDEDWYQFRGDAIDAHWNGLYSGPLMDLQIIIDREPANSNLRAAARIMKAYIFHNMTDLWGDIPYSEALGGLKGGSINPKYDAQKDIYTDLLKELQEAGEALSASNISIPSGDIIFDGDYMKWKKLANSLRIRLAIRMAKQEPAAAKQIVESILANAATYPVFTSNADDAQLVYPGSVQYPNPIYANKYVDSRDDHAISKTMVDILKDRNDPRLAVYANPTAKDGTYVGYPNGTTTASEFNAISRIGSKFRDDAKAPSYLMTYSELQFLIAEAAFNGWSVGKTASVAYSDAVKASMNKQGITDATAIDDYLAQANVSYVAAANKLKVIIEQKWIALFMQGTEAYAEYRRTGYPSQIVEVSGSVYPGKGLPLRLPYVITEETTNGANLATAKQGIVDDMFGKKVWWAQ